LFREAEKIMKSFYDWMIEKYAGKNTARGDMAGDMKRSGDFTRLNDRDMILTYLQGKNSCPECVALFKRCWRDYEREQC